MIVGLIPKVYPSKLKAAFSVRFATPANSHPLALSLMSPTHSKKLS